MSKLSEEIIIKKNYACKKDFCEFAENTREELTDIFCHDKNKVKKCFYNQKECEKGIFFDPRGGEHY